MGLHEKIITSRNITYLAPSNFNLTKIFLFRSRHRRCSVKKGALKNLANFTGKNLCWSEGLQHY